MPGTDLDDIEASAALMLRRARNVVALTGAGISAESGVPTFRGKDGLWKNYNVMELATPHAFERDPKLVWEWYNWRRDLILKCKPNMAHLALMEIEMEKDNFSLVTQNVDGLHDLAGSKNVIKLHGDIWTIRCTRCGKERVDRTNPMDPIPPKCSCGGLLRPGVVWFGEAMPPDSTTSAFEVSGRAEVMLVIGTSGVVQPAASLPLAAKSRGAYLIEINVEKTVLSDIMDAPFTGPAAEILPRIWDRAKED
jgi:NAD-dependent deacetylase